MKLFKLALAFVILAAALYSPGAVRAQTLSYETCFQVQNLETAQATIKISYYESGTTAASTDVNDTIAANGSKTYCPLNAVNDGFNGSVVISSDKQIAAVANVTGQGWGGYNASYAGFSAGALSVNIPLLMKGNYGFNTWYNIQNAGGSATANVSVTYSDGTSTTKQVPVNRAVTVKQADETHSAAVFAATLTSDQPIVVTVMEVGPTTLFGYNAFTSSVNFPVMPLVMANNYGFTTGIQIQNTGTASTNVTVTYTPSSGGTQCTETKSIAAKASATFAGNAWAASDTNADNTCVNNQTFVGSARVTGNTASQGLVAIINQQNFAINKGAAYGSFDPAAATGTVVLPLIMDRNYGYFTGFNIMNVGTSAVTLTCTFTNSTYNEITNIPLAPGAAYTAVNQNKLANGYVGSASCTATGTNPQIAAVVNELAGGADTFLVYEGFSK